MGLVYILYLPLRTCHTLKESNPKFAFPKQSCHPESRWFKDCQGSRLQGFILFELASRAGKWHLRDYWPILRYKIDESCWDPWGRCRCPGMLAKSMSNPPFSWPSHPLSFHGLPRATEKFRFMTWGWMDLPKVLPSASDPTLSKKVPSTSQLSNIQALKGSPETYYPLYRQNLGHAKGVNFCELHVKPNQTERGYVRV